MEKITTVIIRHARGLGGFGSRCPAVDETCHVGMVDGGKLLTGQTQCPCGKFIFGKREREWREGGKREVGGEVWATSGKKGERETWESFFLIRGL